VRVRVAQSLEEVRHELSRLARRRHSRIYDWSTGRPTEWNPEQVLNPETKTFFTPESAWQFIADKLDSGHEIVEVEMRNPPNEKGYEMEIEVDPSYPKLYVKLQLHKGKVFGRSFHYSLRTERK
jgi:hypothetical protein